MNSLQINQSERAANAGWESVWWLTTGHWMLPPKESALRMRKALRCGKRGGAQHETRHKVAGSGMYRARVLSIELEVCCSEHQTTQPGERLAASLEHLQCLGT